MSGMLMPSAPEILNTRAFREPHSSTPLLPPHKLNFWRASEQGCEFGNLLPAIDCVLNNPLLSPYTVELFAKMLPIQGAVQDSFKKLLHIHLILPVTGCPHGDNSATAQSLVAS